MPRKKKQTSLSRRKKQKELISALREKRDTRGNSNLIAEFFPDDRNDSQFPDVVEEISIADEGNFNDRNDSQFPDVVEETSIADEGNYNDRNDSLFPDVVEEISIADEGNFNDRNDSQFPDVVEEISIADEGNFNDRNDSQFPDVVEEISIADEGNFNDRNDSLFPDVVKEIFIADDGNYNDPKDSSTNATDKMNSDEVEGNDCSHSKMSENLKKYFKFEERQTKVIRLKGLKSEQGKCRKRYYKEYKNLRRADPEFKAAENLRETPNKKRKRNENPDYRDLKKEVGAKSTKRADPAFRIAERKSEVCSKQTKRADPEFRAAERRKEVCSKQTKRADPEFRAAERKSEACSKQTKRADLEFRAAEKLRETPNKKRKRNENPDYRDLKKEVGAKSAKRADPAFKIAERKSDVCSKQTKRADLEFRAAENFRETPNKKRKRNENPDYRDLKKEVGAKSTKRADPAFRIAERKSEVCSKKKMRADLEFRAAERKSEVRSKQTKRADREFREAERKSEVRSKQTKRADPEFRAAERKNENASKILQRKKKDNSSTDKLIAEFHKNIENGPTYVCVSCHQLWFRHSVKTCQRLSNSNETAELCLKNDGWVCSTCEKYIKKNKMPPCSIENGMNFPDKPNNLELHPLEWRLLSPRIPFMKVYAAPRGKQKKIRGNVVNVPANVTTTVRMLPRATDDTMTIAAQLKRQLKYNHAVMTENIRPYKIREAAEWLQKHGTLYKKEGICFEENWNQDLENQSNGELLNDTEFAQIPDVIDSGLTKAEGNDGNKDLENQSNGEVMNDTEFAQIPEVIDSGLKKAEGNDFENQGNGKVLNDSEFAQIPEVIDSGLRKAEGNSIAQSDDDNWSEDEGDVEVASSKDTLLTSPDFIENDEKERVHNFAPGEGNFPLSIFMDKNSEELAFPNIFFGNARTAISDRPTKVYYSEICKSELRRDDRRAANCIDNIFFKLKKLQMKTMLGSAQIALRKNKTDGQKITVGDLKNSATVKNLINFDDGYMVLKTLRGSPPYFKKAQSDLFAMIRQLGPATFFCSFSAAETRWRHLLRILGRVQDEKEYTNDEIDSMDWETKSRLVSSDPVTCTRQFDFQVKLLFKDVLKKENSPIGKVTDYFYRVEFQHRGSPHIHTLLWCAEAPVYGESSNEEICNFVDSKITCKRMMEDEKLAEFVKYQTHKHSHTCKRKNQRTCRFGFPKPPMKETKILEPLEIDFANAQKCKDSYSKMKKIMDDMIEGEDIAFDEFLERVDLKYDDYILAIRSSISHPTVFLKRTPFELRVNAYNAELLDCWQANHDIQFVLDVYACAMYIASYIAKSQRGISDILRKACDEVRKGNSGIREQVKAIGNKFLNNVEISAQEAVYIILQLSMRKSSREVVFVNTSPPNDRVKLLKTKEQLEELEDDDDDVQSSNMIARYSKRPKKLEDITLAEFVSSYDKRKRYVKRSKNVEIETLIENAEEHDSDSDEDDETDKSLKRSVPRVIRYVNFNIDKDPEKYYRELLMLYTPWRDELVDLIGNHISYAEKFEQVKDRIAAQQILFENNRSAVDAAMIADKDSMDDAWDKEVPSGQQPEREDEQEEQANIDLMNRKGEPVKFEYDIGPDLGIPKQDTEDAIKLYEMPENEYRQLMRSMNVEQMKFVNDTLRVIKTSENQVFRFLSGGAGVGKSFVTTALYQSLLRYYKSKAGDDYQTIRQLMLAPTGKAAFNIKGNTIHSALKIPANQNLEYKSLDCSRLNSIRTQLGGLKVVFIDEISMVGNRMMNFINRRLQDIKGSPLVFGGVHVIAVGDLFQLKPVFDCYVFQNLNNLYGPLASNLWKDNFQMYELTEIMRQKDSKRFAEMLNRLREDNFASKEQKMEDMALFKTRVLSMDDGNYPYDAQHLFVSNRKMDEFNSKIFEQMSGDKYIITAKDSVVGSEAHAVEKALLANVPDDPRKTMQLHKQLNLVTGMKCELCINVKTDDGLTNGADGTVRLIEAPNRRTAVGNIVWVEFRDEIVGKLTRNELKNLYKANMNKSWTPILPVSRQIRIGRFKNAELMRTQIPLRPSAAKTVHRSQGDTLDEVVVDFGGMTMAHIHYVGLSRVKTLEGLHIVNLAEDKIRISMEVKDEMLSLRNERKLEIQEFDSCVTDDDSLKVIYHNVRSLQKYIEDVKMSHVVKKAHVVILSETRLKLRNDNLYEIPGYSLYRNDAFTSSNKNHHGIAVYVKSNIVNDLDVSVQPLNRQDIEMSLLNLSVRLDNCLKNVNILGVYKPPKTPVANLISAVGNVKRCWKIDDYSLILGDFNIQLNSNEYVRLNFELNGMEQCILEPTTNAGTTIDFLFSNVPCELKKCGIIENYFSDHKLIYTVIASKSSKASKSNIASKSSIAFDTMKLDEHRTIPKRIVKKKKIECSEQKCAEKIRKCKVGKNDKAVIVSDLICCRGFGYSLKESDLKTLAGNNWLNDQVINFYMKILERDENLNGTDVAILDTFAYLRIESNMQAAVEMLTDCNLLTFSKILIPIHTPHHWSLVVVYVDSKTIKYYDSVVHKDAGYKCMRKIRDFLLLLENIQPSNWIQIYEEETTLQLNGYDCGVCTCMNAWLVLEGRSLKVRRQEIAKFRKRMISQIDMYRL